MCCRSAQYQLAIFMNRQPMHGPDIIRAIHDPATLSR